MGQPSIKMAEMCDFLQKRLAFSKCCGSGSALIWLWIQIRIRNADPDPGA
jgi:hypothetical protein